MPGKFVEHIPCTSEDCGSSDAMAVYQDEDGSYNATCFACKHYDPDPYKEGKPVKVQREKPSGNMDNVGKLKSLPDPNRGLRGETMEYFGVRTEVSEVDGRTITAHYYPYTKDGKVTGYKRRECSDKTMFSIGDIKGAELFGQHQCVVEGSRKKLFITEGECDAMALWQVLKDKNKGTKWDYIIPSVVSVGSGASGAMKDIARNIEFVRSFESVVLVFDQDEPGQKAVQQVARLLPGVHIAKFSEKDPNDMLLKGKSAELIRAVLFNTEKYKPQSVVTVDDVFDRAVARPQMGLSWPWPTLTKLTYGIHRKKMYGLGAGVGIGKTDWAKELQNHLVNHHHLPIGTFMLEEDVGRTLKSIAGKFHKKPFHKPDGNYTQEELEKAISELRGKVMLYDHQGCKDWDEIKAAIRYMVVGEGIKDIFIDPLTALVAHLSSGEANDALNTIMGELASLLHELDFTVYYFCHLNPPSSGPPHERGGKVHEGQFTGSRAMMRWSQYLFGLERNKDPELDEDTRNTSRFVLLKDRDYGNVGAFPIYYNKETTSYLEPEDPGF